ncbi:MAG: PKD domain-containing protein [Bacteroidota bacterium]
MYRLLITWSCLVLALPCLNAQTTLGTEFWLGYMENLNIAFNDAPEFSIIITASAPTSGEITVGSVGPPLPFSVAAGTTEIFLPDGVYYAFGSENVSDFGIRVSTNAPVQVQAYHYRLYFAESTNLLPSGELGTEYLITTLQDLDNNATPNSFMVVATASNTTVEIVPAAATLAGRPANVPFTVTLNEGQSYQVQSLGALTGTSVRSISGQPLAVFSGALQADLPTSNCTGGADSHVWDQALPLEDWRALYYFVPFAGQGGDYLQILAATDNTEVFFDCGRVATLDQGEFYVTQRETATVISATGPISVWQYNNGGSCEPSQVGDPNGLQYLPADFLGTDFGWWASNRVSVLSGNPNFALHWVTIVGPTDATNDVTLDGQAVTNFQSFPADPNWSYATATVTIGSHSINAPAGVQAYSYGFGEFDAYTQHMGYTFTDPQQYACLDIEREGILCVDSLQQFTYNSTLNLNQWDWDLGDNTTSTLPEPTHIYTAPGTYEVILIGTTAEGVTASDTLSFVVIDCPEEICSNAVAQLSTQISGDLCVNALQDFSFSTVVNPVSVSWDFGDGSPPSTAFSPQHFYANPGTYTFTLTLEDELGCVYTIANATTITDCVTCPTGNETLFPSVEGNLCPGEILLFDANYPLPGIPLFETSWDFANGQGGFGETATTIYNAPGVYPVSFFGFNAEGCLYTGTLNLTVEDCGGDPCSNPPALFIDGPQEFCVGEVVEFMVMTTANLVDIQWTNLGVSGTTSVPFTAFLAGSDVITLTATDNNGCTYTANFPFTVQDCTEPCTNLPSLVIDGPQTFCVGEEVTYVPITEANLVGFSWSDFFTESVGTPTFTTSIATPTSNLIVLNALDDDGCVYAATLPYTAVECEPCTDLPASNIFGPVELCVAQSGSYLFQFAEDITTYNWSASNGQMQTDTLDSFSFSADQVGSFTINAEAVDIDGCVYSNTFTVEVVECEEDCSDVIINDITFTNPACVDSVATFTATVDIAGDYTRFWTGDIDVFLAFTDTLEQTFEEVGSYTVFYDVNRDDCFVRDSVLVTVVDCSPCAQYSPHIVGEAELCLGQAGNYGVESEIDLVSYAWSGNGVTGTGPNFLLGFSTPGSYPINLITEDNDGCIDTVTFITNVVDCDPDCNDLALESITIPTLICTDEPTTLVANLNAVGAVSSSWTQDELNLLEQGDTLIVNFPAAGEYTFLYQANRLDCSLEEFFSVEVVDCVDCDNYALTDFIISGDTCVFETISIRPEGTNLRPTDTYEWLLPDGNIVSKEILDFTFGEAGSYTFLLTATSVEGCVTTRSLTIEACVPVLNCNVYAPNVFSPNRDGRNDGFRLYFSPECQPISFTGQIFDRWGGQVFQTTNPDEEWNGSTRGQDLPTGVYVYSFRYTFADGESGTSKGSVTLLR